MEKWFDKQIEFIVGQWDKAIELYYPQYLSMWREPKEHYRCLHELWNTLDAVKMVEWDKFFIFDDLKVLDLGCGTGWLSAFLSNNSNVKEIAAVDSSEFFLEIMLPEVATLMQGRLDKIARIQGLFSPIVRSNEYFDFCVSSSALHHADSLEGTLTEISRVLKKGGRLFILNETPYEKSEYLNHLKREYDRIKDESEKQQYSKVSPYISSSGCLYDQFLWDRLYPQWYWLEAIKRAGFCGCDVVETGLYSLKTDKSGLTLRHFICTK